MSQQQIKEIAKSIKDLASSISGDLKDAEGRHVPAASWRAAEIHRLADEIERLLRKPACEDENSAE